MFSFDSDPTAFLALLLLVTVLSLGIAYIALMQMTRTRGRPSEQHVDPPPHRSYFPAWLAPSEQHAQQRELEALWQKLLARLEVKHLDRALYVVTYRRRGSPLQEFAWFDPTDRHAGHKALQLLRILGTQVETHAIYVTVQSAWPRDHYSGLSPLGYAEEGDFMERLRECTEPLTEMEIFPAHATMPLPIVGDDESDRMTTV
jgi:hypothetical protein